MPWGYPSVGLGRSMMMFWMVEHTSFMSWRCAPSITTLIGTPCPSVSMLRLTPFLPRSVGLGPVFFPAQRSFRHGFVHGEPVPVDPTQFIETLDASLPQFEKNASFYPFLKAVV